MEKSIIQRQLSAVRKFNHSRICDLLQWNCDQLNTFIYNSGLQYLEEYFDGDEKPVNILSARKEFWSWWKGLWNGRDDAYLDDIDGREEVILKTRQELYYMLHNVKVLAAEIHPPRMAYPPGFTHIKMEMA